MGDFTESIDQAVGLMKSATESLSAIKPEYLYGLTAISAILCVINMILSVMAFHNSMIKNKLENMNLQMEYYNKFEDSWKKHLKVYQGFSNQLSKLDQGQINLQDLIELYNLFQEFLPKYSRFLVRYLHLQHYGLKNKYEKAILKDQVKQFVDFYISLKKAYMKINELKNQCPFSVDQIKPLIRFLGLGVFGKIRILPILVKYVIA